METRSKKKILCISRDCGMTVTDLGQMMVETKRKTDAKTKSINSSGRREGIKSNMYYLRTRKDRKAKCRKAMVAVNIRNKDRSIPINSDGRIVPTRLVPAKNPLDIAGVIHSVLNFLPLQDIKNCSLVNKEWHYVAEPFIRKLSQISLGHSYSSRHTRTNDEFNNAFQFSQTKIPFTALHLKGSNRACEPWSKSDLTDIFMSWGNNLKELSFDCAKGLEKFPVNMSEILKQSYLTKLNVDCDLFSHTLIFSLETFLHLKYLRLVGCDLLIPEESTNKISPVEVEIRRCRIWFDNHNDNRIINTFIDFSKTKSLQIVDALKDYKKKASLPVPTTALKLDLSGNFVLNFVALGGVSILNWGDSTWTIGTMYLDRVEFSGVTTLNLRHFKVDDSLVSLSHIPETVEKLSIEGTKFTLPPYLPNLKYLVFFPEVLNTLRCFRDCPSLTSLKLGGSYAPLTSMSIDSFPKNLKNLQIQGQIKLTGTGTVNVETLVLFYQSVEDVREHLKVFKTEKIVWLLKEKPVKKIGETVLELLENIKWFAVGQFNWSDSKKFPNNAFSHCVDRKGGYYIFNNGRGQAISEDQFYKMIPL